MTTLGQRLKEAREAQRLTLEKVFDATRIRIQYLQALEEDDHSVMPSPVQARGYMRNYAEFLGLNVENLLTDMREASAQKPSEEVIGPADVAAEETQTPQPTLTTDDVPVQGSTLPVKPKPVRRKKADSQPLADPATTPRRRGRKKAQTELESVAQIETLEAQPLVVEEPAIEIVPIVEEVSPQPIEESVPPLARQDDVNESLWQIWLNRLTSGLRPRNKEPLVEEEREVAFRSDGLSTESEPDSPASESIAGSTLIFREIGRVLRGRRELLSLHLEEVERNTHVKAHYLEALERGVMDDLPSTVQTRGMLSNYATFLDLDVDALLLRFADALQTRHRERNPQRPVRKPGQPILASLPPMRTFIAGDMIFGIGIVVLLVGFAIWGMSWVLTLQSEREVKPTAPSISEILLASPDPSSFTSTPTYMPVESFPGEATATVVIPTLNVNVNVQVNLVAVERTYMRVIADREVIFEGRVVPGTAYPFEAEEQIEVLVGSGAAIRVVYNGRDLGLLGSLGQVVSNIYLGDQIITPTGMPSLTPTVTSTPTRTAVPTSTSRFTATPIPSNTAVP